MGHTGESRSRGTRPESERPRSRLHRFPKDGRRADLRPFASARVCCPCGSRTAHGAAYIDHRGSRQKLAQPIRSLKRRDRNPQPRRQHRLVLQVRSPAQMGRTRGGDRKVCAVSRVVGVLAKLNAGAQESGAPPSRKRGTPKLPRAVRVRSCACGQAELQASGARFLGQPPSRPRSRW